MRNLFSLLGILLLLSCNNSKKKTINQDMDDTARYNGPPSTTEIVAYRLMERDIPGLKYEGDLRDAYKWTDRLGENIMVTSSVKPYKDSKQNQYGEEGETAELHAYHWVKKSTGSGGDKDYAEVWTLKDGVQGCPFDITSNFISEAITVTDLDKNGIAEVKLQYMTACRSDVSPAEMKLLLYENRNKYELSGYSWLPYSPEMKFTVTENDVNLEKLPGYTEDDYEKNFGRYRTEKEFANAPAPFLNYARSEWLKFVKEKMPD